MEETRLISEIGHWIFLDACKTAVAWPKNIRVAVNVSAEQLRKTNILSTVVKALTASTLPARRLEIEITETAVIDDCAQVLSNIRSCATSAFALHWTIWNRIFLTHLSAKTFA